MNIIFLNLAPADEWGGGESWTLYTAAGLAERRHRVLVIGRAGAGMDRQASGLGLEGASVPVGMDYSPKTIAALLKIITRFRPDVIVVHHNKDVRTGGVAARIAGIPVVHRNGFPILKNTRRHRLTYRLTDRILTNSRRIRDLYLSFGWVDEQRVDVVPNGIRMPVTPGDRNIVRKEWGVNEEDLVALYAGRLTGVKRVEDLLEVFARLDDSSRWKLVIYGRGSREQSLRQRAAGSDLRGRIFLKGYLPDVSERMTAADLLLLTSAEEGMPNALMEAMARSVPVAATPVGDVPFLLDEGQAGWLLPVGDITAWTKLLRTIESDEHALETMGQKGKKRMRDTFTMERMLDGVEASLQRAVEEAGKRRG